MTGKWIALLGALTLTAQVEAASAVNGATSLQALDARIRALETEGRKLRGQA